MNKPGRLLSLDVFRGMTICLMIVVNNPGSWASVYAPLRHSAWHGCTPTDLVFPLFIYVLSIVLAITFRIEFIHSGSGEMVSVTNWLLYKRRIFIKI